MRPSAPAPASPTRPSSRWSSDRRTVTRFRFEAEITPGMAPGQVADLAVAVERAGFDRLGISDVVLWHDCYVLMTLCAAATERLEFGPLVTNPYSRHPVVLAGAIATLGEISGGRAFLGLGVGAGLEQFGMDYPEAGPHPAGGGGDLPKAVVGRGGDLRGGRVLRRPGAPAEPAGGDAGPGAGHPQPRRDAPRRGVGQPGAGGGALLVAGAGRRVSRLARRGRGTGGTPAGGGGGVAPAHRVHLRRRRLGPAQRQALCGALPQPAAPAGI